MVRLFFKLYGLLSLINSILTFVLCYFVSGFTVAQSISLGVLLAAITGAQGYVLYYIFIRYTYAIYENLEANVAAPREENIVFESDYNG